MQLVHYVNRTHTSTTTVKTHGSRKYKCHQNKQQNIGVILCTCICCKALDKMAHNVYKNLFKK
jgi:hypothetical protein